MVEALIFDCDGTLTDSMPLHFLAWRATLDRLGLRLAEERFYALAGMPTRVIVEMLAAEQGLAIDAEGASRAKEKAFLDQLWRLEAIPPVRDLVLENHGRRKMAVASGGTRAVVLAQLRQVGLVDYFSVIVTAEDAPRCKPAPDIFLEAARRLGAPPELCEVYEDADLGVAAARAAGMRCVDIRPLHTPRRFES